MPNRIGTLEGPRLQPFAEDGAQEQATPLERAVATRNANTVDPSAFLDPDAGRPPAHRAREAEMRVDRATRAAIDAVDGWWVTDKDCERALRELKALRPDELGRALWRLQDSGMLDELMSELEPEQLVAFAEMLKAGGIFRWQPAVNEKQSPVEGGPTLIEAHDRLPPSLRALARDINLEVAKRTPELELYEPGANGFRLDPNERHQFDWVGGIRGTVETYVNRYLSVIDVETSVKQLRPGDSYRLNAKAGVEVGIGASARKAGAELKAGPSVSYGIEVARSEEGFTVSADAALVAMVSATLGLGIAEARGELSQGGAGKLEFKFAHADEATRAAKLLIDAQGAPAKFGLQWSLDPTARSLLLDNVSALELGPQAAAKLGITGRQGLLDQAAAEAGASIGTSYRIELEKGEPKALKVKTSLQFERTLSKKLELEGEVFKVGQQISLQTTVKAELEQGIALTPGMTLGQAAKAAWNPAASLTLSLESSGGTGFGGGANELSFKVEGEANGLMSAAASLVRGDVAGSLEPLKHAEITRRQTASSGLSVSVGIDAKRVEAGLEFSGMKKRQISEHVQEGSGRKVALDLVQSLRSEARPGEIEPLQHYTVRPD